MSALHNGKLNSMRGKYIRRQDDGNGTMWHYTVAIKLTNHVQLNFVGGTFEIKVIRPLIYVRERQLREFAETAKLPVITDNCPACFAQPTER